MMHHVTLIHGIHEGLTDPGWTGALKARLALSGVPVVVETEKYQATALPWWNVYLKNPRYAKHHANLIDDFSRKYTLNRLPGSAGESGVQLPSFKVHLIAHSNGTDIALKTVLRLAAMGIRTETLILVSAAVHSDVERSKLARVIESGHLRRAIAYCNDSDVVIGGLQWIPGGYGSLGTLGFERDGVPTGIRVEGYQQLDGWGDTRHRYITRWFRGFGHSGVLRPANYDRTFASFEADMGLIRA